MTLQNLENQLHSAQALLKAARKDGVYEWGLWEIERYVKECQRAYTKALKQRNKNENNDRTEPFFRRNELTPRAIGRYSYRDVKETTNLPNATNTTFNL